MMQQSVILLCMCLLLSCASSRSSSENIQKCDAPLRQRLEVLEQANDSGAVEVIGKCSSHITNEHLEKLCSTGAAIGTVTGDIFTASGTTSAIYSLAGLEFVSRLELSQEARPLQH